MTKLHETLKYYFGYDTFRPLQESIITHILDGNDALVIMPTGGGKSLCFQLPALVMDGMTLVISPLIALMKDQVDALRANGVKADYINSSLDAVEKNDIRNRIKNRQTKILYLAPESLSALDNIRQVSPISLIAIDEAHCISSRGHDFRPAYTNLQILKRQFPQTPLVALTATADHTTRSDILKQLSIPGAQVFLSSFDRPNLSLDVRPAQKRIQQIVSYVSTKPGESGIIYCLGRKTTEKIAQKLEDAGISAKAYHAGMTNEKRSKVQEDFLMDRTDVICATIAFGMGIDKSNVRYVIHYNLPKNIEGYYQEIGRAGRDGLASETLLFYSYGDVVQLTKFARDASNSQVQLAKLERMKQYAESLTCRRKILLHYFGEARNESCGNCDVCNHPPTFIDGTVIAQKALSAITRIGQKETISVVIDFLRGSKNHHILSHGYDQIKTYGIGADISSKDRHRYIIQLVNLGLCRIAFENHNALMLTDASRDVLFEGKQIQVAQTNQSHISQKQKEGQSMSKDSGGKNSAPSLFENLRKLRLSLAQSQNVPAYVIMSDATLKDIESKLPTTAKKLEKVSGLGSEKIKRYGRAIIQVVKSFQELIGTRKTKSKPRKGSTYDETYQLYKQNTSMERIAKKRGIQVNTIATHLVHLADHHKDVDLKQYITPEFLISLRSAYTSLDGVTALRPYYDHFEELVSYGDIKMGLAIIGKENGE